jgi:hypothetical protein
MRAPEISCMPYRSIGPSPAAGRRAEDADRAARLRAFDFLAEQTALHGDVLPWATLYKGFTIDGQRYRSSARRGSSSPQCCAIGAQADGIGDRRVLQRVESDPAGGGGGSCSSAIVAATAFARPRSLRFARRHVSFTG